MKNNIYVSTLYGRGTLKGSAAMSVEEIANAAIVISAQLQQVQTARAAEQVGLHSPDLLGSHLFTTINV